MDGAIDLEGLNEKAKASDDGEGYLLLTKGEGYRMGLVARVSKTGIIYSMEVLTRVLDRDHAVDAARMEQALRLTKVMTDRGYALTTEDDGWIYAERAVDPDLIGEEGRFMEALIGGLFT